MLNVLHVFVSDGHAQLKQLLVYLFLGVLELVLQALIRGIDLLSESHLSHFVVHLSKLLHFHVMLTNQVLFLLS